MVSRGLELSNLTMDLIIPTWYIRSGMGYPLFYASLRNSPFPSLNFLAVCFLSLQPLVAQTEVSGLNLSADEGFGARYQGTALLRSGFQTGADAVVNAPASMNDVDDFTFSTAHAEQFGAARYDCIALLVPWHEMGTLGIGLSRYSVSDIPVYRSTVPDEIPSGKPDGWLTTSDWLFAGSFSRKWGPFDLGTTLHILYRKLDQNGLGMRVDGMAQYTFWKTYRMGTFIRGLVPSLARWQSERMEYEPSEIILMASTQWDEPYFYGKAQLGWESAGLFQEEAKSSQELAGKRGIQDPLSLLKTSHLGGEFQFDFGLVLRAGLESLDPKQTWESVHLGTGFHWKKIGFDYGFSTHPGLPTTHRIALQLTPNFPKFKGRNFRPGSKIAAIPPKENPVEIPEAPPEGLEDVEEE